MNETDFYYRRDSEHEGQSKTIKKWGIIGRFSREEEYKDKVNKQRKELYSLGWESKSDVVLSALIFIFSVLPLIISVLLVTFSEGMFFESASNETAIGITATIMMLWGGIVTFTFSIGSLIFIDGYGGLDAFESALYKGLVFPIVIKKIGDIKDNKIVNYDRLNTSEKLSIVFGYNFDYLINNNQSGNLTHGYIYDKLNTVVELPNGYVTYLSNVVSSVSEGIVLNEDVKIVSGDKELIADGFLITESNIDEFYTQLKQDYEYDKEYKRNKIEYERLQEQERIRKKQMDYIRKNKSGNEEKRKEVEDVLYIQSRKSDMDRKSQELKEVLLELKKNIENLQ